MITLTPPTPAPTVRNESSPWKWKDPPKFTECGSQFCLTFEEGKQFLHWYVEQRAGAEKLVVDIELDRDKWKARATVAPETGASKALTIVGSVAAGLLAGLGTGIGLGFYFGSSARITAQPATP